MFIAALISLVIIRTTKMPLEISTYIFLMSALFGSVLPDADHKSTRVGKVIPLWLFFKHRTVTHSIIIILLMVLVTKINYYVGYGLFIGVSSHILSDLFTVNGCPFFYPLSKEKQRLGKIKTGGKDERKIVIIVGALLIILSGIYALDFVKYLGDRSYIN
ncbi:inner membrane protein [Natronincola peptidivorans]|uniref:Inner membrane protein n=1 Tax=Natronincola peptidivorans TaxID=426128 RepID=A0A1I0HKI1_9FIRM|nr:metal-dependent hydrolase [Natronincola peptidivorans]SET83604.1 inner membrane protein [Natronincola peptidivorans]